ncbi:probable ATP-dependent RNA helicase DDX56 isoform X2 [Penaeus chinensis]|uniref:probable ATP-dependent RNA helicase DDX56 isoform X2 n=1 Tax=Penaeus chinensis TaxID=139456 RepID=UPI001FB57E65|nr:probable ATP-dependent RNA helicase DDX56 isoform X2 [Penaeus chinensis]
MDSEESAEEPSPPSGRHTWGDRCKQTATMDKSQKMSEVKQEDDENTLQFHEMGLDDRILEAIARLRWGEPTLIQEKAIPYVLEGKDVLAKARTGSGKTGAFVIPTIHKILEWKRSATEQMVQAIMLAPSKELCKQIKENLTQLTTLCKREVRFIDVSPTVPLEAQRPLLVDKPDIVIGTPMRILAHLNEGNLMVKDSLKMLVIDEADLMFAFDHVKEIQEILKKFPKIFQSFVTSATMFDDVKKLKTLILHNPVILRLEEPPLPTAEQLTQYVIKLSAFDKVVLVNALFRLNMIRGKTIIFVNSVDKGYRLRMYLAHFDISSCVLNSEMPVASRCHIIEQFNSGKYDIIIASDEHNLEASTAGTSQGGTSKRQRNKDKESGVSRGIDFQFVSNIINFDFPLNVDSYIHRVGRTARGTNQGTALSLVAKADEDRFKEVETRLKALMPDTGPIFKDFKFDITQLDGFRYRSIDAWKRCTSIAVKETRKKEIRQELLNTSKLKTFFEDNPRDLEVLRHDVPKHGLKPMTHLKNVPEYNIPDPLRTVSKGGKRLKFNKNIPKAKLKKMSNTHRKFQEKKSNPLKSMEFTGFKKRK